MPEDLYNKQLNRGMLVGQFLDVTLEEWAEWVKRVGDDEIPQVLHQGIVQIIEGLQGAPETYQSYLQALALLSDEALAWLVGAVKAGA